MTTLFTPCKNPSVACNIWFKALYIITFIIVIILIVAFIALFILVSLPKSKNYMKIMNSGRLISLGVLILTGIAFIFS